VLTTDRGAVGWGISWASDEDLSDLIGRRVTELFDPCVGVVAPEAMPLDFPLHDLAGMILDQPVYQMLGPRGDQTVLCYDGAIYMDDLLPPENPGGTAAVLANCDQDYQRGYRSFKLKIGRGYRWMEAEAGRQRDVEVTRAVRERFPDCEILVDANDGYTCEAFLRYLDTVADCRLYWVEEPFPENRADLLRLREFLAKRSPQTLIADGESGYDIEFLLELARDGLVDVLIMDIVGLGFTRWRRWMPRLVAAGACASPHTWGDPIKTWYACQLAAGLGNVVTVEGIPAQSSDVDWGLYGLHNGIVHIPPEPGFGIKLCRHWSRRH
jgi:L-alanine-DL-glutamate epimerase-like enolase superfamily enzyme